MEKGDLLGADLLPEGEKHQLREFEALQADGNADAVSLATQRFRFGETEPHSFIRLNDTVALRQRLVDNACEV